MNTPRTAIMDALAEIAERDLDLEGEAADLIIAKLRERRHMLDQWHCRDGGPHTNPSPSQTPAAWCNDCGAVVPIPHFTPEETSYLIDGRDQRIPEGLRKDVRWCQEENRWRL